MIAVPLLSTLREEQAAPGRTPAVHRVIIDVNLEYKGGRDEARRRVRELITQAIAAVGIDKDPRHQGVNERKSEFSQQYVFAHLEGEVIRELVRKDGQAGATAAGARTAAAAADRAIYRIWPDFPVNALTIRSVKTVKADAARVAYAALGEGIVWAVLDSGIQADHPHFRLHENLKHEPPLKHRDFTTLGDGDGAAEALVDTFGHGTHVAGILAGEHVAKEDADGTAVGSAPASGEATERRGASPGRDGLPGIRAFSRYRDEHGE
ncbi:MAG: S8 family serine peptidase [Chloroflexota bacterium]|nr:S8 family serine peptidase [Chloroflexota bacterium]